MSNLKAQQQLISQISISASTKIRLPQWDLPFLYPGLFDAVYSLVLSWLNLLQAIIQHALIQLHFTWFPDLLPSTDGPSLWGTATVYSENIWIESLSVDVFSRITEATHHKMLGPADIPMLCVYPNLWNKLFSSEKRFQASARCGANIWGRCPKLQEAWSAGPEQSLSGVVVRGQKPCFLHPHSLLPWKGWAWSVKWRLLERERTDLDSVSSCVDILVISKGTL